MATFTFPSRGHITRFFRLASPVRHLTSPRLIRPWLRFAVWAEGGRRGRHLRGYHVEIDA